MQLSFAFVLLIIENQKRSIGQKKSVFIKQHK
jgi:hypothetical protein